MKTNHTPEQLQSAIDAAFKNPDRARMLATRSGSYEWNLQALCRMKIAHEFIELLPEPPPHVADVRLPAVEAKKEMPVGLNSALDVWPDEPKDRPSPAVEAEKPVKPDKSHVVCARPDCPQTVTHYEGSCPTCTAKPADTFEAHGKTWTRHTPGDPMPCDGERMVVVVVGKHDQPESLPQKGSYWLWTSKVFNCIGWRYADQPTLAPDKPWTPKVGDVVTLKSGGPKMTVMRPAKGYDGELIEGELACMWATEADSHMIHANPATLQPA